MTRLDSLAAAEDLGQPLGGQLLIAGFGGHVGVSGEEIPGAIAARQDSGKQHQQEQWGTTHWYSG